MVVELSPPLLNPLVAFVTRLTWIVFSYVLSITALSYNLCNLEVDLVNRVLLCSVITAPSYNLWNNEVHFVNWIPLCFIYYSTLLQPMKQWGSFRELNSLMFYLLQHPPTTCVTMKTISVPVCLGRTFLLTSAGVSTR